MEAICVSHVSFIFVFRTRTEIRCMGKLFLCCHLAYFILRTLLNSLSLLPSLFGFIPLFSLFYKSAPLPLVGFFLLNSSPLSLLLLYLFFLYFLSRSVRRHSSENAGCSFSMYEVFSITLKPVKSVSQMMLKLKQTNNPFLLQPSDFF